MAFPSQIIGSFEDIGKDIVSEVVKVPGEIAGKALESLGAKSSSNQTAKAIITPSGEKSSAPADAWDHIDAVKETKGKEVVARAALEALLKRTKPKEPGIYERIQSELKQRKEFEDNQKAQVEHSVLPQTGSKPKQGSRFNIGVKQSSDKGKNVIAE